MQILKRSVVCIDSPEFVQGLRPQGWGSSLRDNQVMVGSGKPGQLAFRPRVSWVWENEGMSTCAEYYGEMVRINACSVR